MSTANSSRWLRCDGRLVVALKVLDGVRLPGRDDQTPHRARKPLNIRLADVMGEVEQQRRIVAEAELASGIDS